MKSDWKMPFWWHYEDFFNTWKLWMEEWNPDDYETPRESFVFQRMWSKFKYFHDMDEVMLRGIIKEFNDEYFDELNLTSDVPQF